MYNKIFFKEIVFGDLSKVAIIFGIAAFIYSFGCFIGEYFKKLSTNRICLILLFVGFLDILAYYIYSFPLSLMIIFPLLLTRAVSGINLKARVNDLIPSNIRATTLSTKGFLESVGSIIALFCFGLTVDGLNSYQNAFIIFAIISFVGSFVIYLFLRKYFD